MTSSTQTPRVLFFASTSYAGMGPYVASIINSFTPEDNIGFFLVEREDQYFSRNIKPELKQSGIIYLEKTPTKLKTLWYLTIDGGYDCRNKLKEYCNQFNPAIIHALTNIDDVELCKWMIDRYKILYTIHDLHPHEANKSFLKEFRQNVIYKREYRSIELSGNIHTNSVTQFKELKILYPTKASFYSPFPTLITSEIEDGKVLPPELSNVTDYILFFGRIEAYKGIDKLIEAYLSSPTLQQSKLVIAGKGEMNRPVHKNIIYLNRYIGDNEIAALYNNAACVVYPYISITQSGVLSVAMHFGTPIIASDLPFFKEVLKSDYPWFTKTGDSDSLRSTLENFMSVPHEKKSATKVWLKNLYQAEYASESSKHQLEEIYAQL